VQSAPDTASTHPEAATPRYRIDPRRSTFTVQAFSTGLLSAFGHSPKIAVRDIQGDVQFVSTGASLQDVTLQVVIQPDTMGVIGDISDKDQREINRQMHDEVLEVDRFPEIRYDCSNITVTGTSNQYWATLNGELTLHGETHRQVITARVVLNGDVLRASGEFEVRQIDFGIAVVKVAGGAIKLKDEVKCTFDVVARKA
jgi:polyisoprenoid-binding protein YceI